MFEYTKYFKDPVHGYIGVTESEVKFIDNNAWLQRLRRISHLALCKLVYIGANHTRFDHSLGVLYVITKMIESLHKNSSLESILGNLDMEYEDCLKNMRLVALIHDVGHYPFSHPLELIMAKLIYKVENRDLARFTNSLLKYYKTHEISNLFILCKKLKERIISLGYDFKFIFCTLHHKVLEEFDKSKSKVYGNVLRELLPSEIDETLELYRKCNKEFEILHKLIDSDFDADRVDNLLRDSYYAGVGYGAIDIERLLNNLYLRLHNNQYYIAFDVKAQGEVERFFLARYYIYRYVYHHHKVALFDEAIRRLVEKLIEKKNEIIKDFFDFTFGKMKDENALTFDDYMVLNEIYRNRALIEDDELISSLFELVFQRKDKFFSLWKRDHDYISSIEFGSKKKFVKMTTEDIYETFRLRRENLGTVIVAEGLERSLREYLKSQEGLDTLISVKAFSPVPSDVYFHTGRERVCISEFSPQIDSLDKCIVMKPPFYVYIYCKDCDREKVKEQKDKMILHVFTAYLKYLSENFK